MPEVISEKELINETLSKILNGYNIVDKRGYVLRCKQFEAIYPRLASKIISKLNNQGSIGKKEIKNTLGRDFNVVETSILRNLPTMVIKYFSTKELFGRGVQDVYETLSIAPVTNVVQTRVKGEIEYVDVISYVYSGRTIPIMKAKEIIDRFNLSVCSKNESGTVFDKKGIKSFKYFVKETKAKEMV